MLNTRFSLQASTFLNVQWPRGASRRPECDSCPEDCPADCSCFVGPGQDSQPGQANAGCSGICGINGIKYLPKNYLFSYKHEALATVNQDRPGGGEASVIAKVNAKGAVAQTWMVVVPGNADWADGRNVQEWDCTCSAEPRTRRLPPYVPPAEEATDVAEDAAAADATDGSAQSPTPPPSPPTPPPSPLTPPPWDLEEGDHCDGVTHGNNAAARTSCAALEAQCRTNLFAATSEHPAKVTRYYGSLTGLAVTKPPLQSRDDVKEARVYACGQPHPDADFFLYRLKFVAVADVDAALDVDADGSAEVALIEEIIPLSWLGTQSMTIEKCMLAFQPGSNKVGAGLGWRSSAGIRSGWTDAPRLWVAPKAVGALAWTATARGCKLWELGGPRGGKCEYNGADKCDCSGVLCSDLANRPAGYLQKSTCMLKQTDLSEDALGGEESHHMAWENWNAYVQDTSLKGYERALGITAAGGEGGLTASDALNAAGLGGAVASINQAVAVSGALTSFASGTLLGGGAPAVLLSHFAAHVVIGADVEGLAFFDNKLDESHVAITRCSQVGRR